MCSTLDQALQAEALAGDVGTRESKKPLVASCYVEAVPACRPPGSYADLTFYLYPLVKTMLKFHNEAHTSFMSILLFTFFKYYFLKGLKT